MNDNLNKKNNPDNAANLSNSTQGSEVEILDEISSSFQKFIEGVSFVVDAILSVKKFMTLRSLERSAKSIMHLKSKMSALTDQQLQAKTQEFRQRLEKESLDDIMVEAFAVAREAARRVLGEEHYKVQIMGGLALHQGMIAEMKTGEGKTLVTVLPTYLNALTGKGVHVVTVNDYLAKRDAEWMGRVHEFLGLTVGCVHDSLHPAERKKQYSKDITYVTSSQLGFDYLRDNLIKDMSELSQVKGFNYCIVDEADSVLIDEARVPLIISDSVDDEKSYQDLELYKAADKIIKMLNPSDYKINLKEKKVNFTDEGVDKVEKLCQDFGLIPGASDLHLPQHSALLHHLSQCLKANHIDKLGIEFYKAADKIIKMLNPSDYKINLKEKKVDFTDDGIGKVGKLCQDFDLIPPAGELYLPEHSVLLHHLSQCLKANHIYKIGIEYIVDNKHNSIKLIDEHTGRILYGRRYSEGLHQALEAKEGVEIKKETETQASITFQKLFRLYRDSGGKLSGMTGTAITEAEEFEKTYNLYCISIPTNTKSKRIDHDASLYGRIEDKMEAITELIKDCYNKGQPVIVGTVNVQSSEEVAAYLRQARIPIRMLNAKNHEEEADIIANAGRYGMITVVTNMAGRGTDIKLGGDPKVLIKQKLGQVALINSEDEQKIIDEVKLDIKLNREKVIKAGGLFVIGVEHNPNRRIDNQLRGRAGRQGDIGESKFFCAMQDELPRKFLSNPEMIESFLDKGEDITSRLSSRLLAYWQTLDEGHNFDSRQHMQKYADIKEFYMENFYKERQNVLYRVPLMTWINNFAANFILHHNKAILGHINDHTKIKDKGAYLQDMFFNKINQIFEIHGDYAEQYLRDKILSALDKMWRAYLATMDYQRNAVILYQYANKDPVIIYQKKAEVEFEKLSNDMYLNIAVEILQTTPSQAHDFSKFNFNTKFTNKETFKDTEGSERFEGFNTEALEDLLKDMNLNKLKDLPNINHNEFEEMKNKLHDLSSSENPVNKFKEIIQDEEFGKLKDKVDSVFAKHNIDPMKIFDKDNAFDPDFMARFKAASDEVSRDTEIQDLNDKAKEKLESGTNNDIFKEHLKKTTELFKQMPKQDLFNADKMQDLLSSDKMQDLVKDMQNSDVFKKLVNNPSEIENIKEQMKNLDLDKIQEQMKNLDLDKIQEQMKNLDLGKIQEQMKDLQNNKKSKKQ